MRLKQFVSVRYKRETIMKTSIIFFLLAVSASAVLSDTETDIEVASKAFGDSVVRTLTKFTEEYNIQDDDIIKATTAAGSGFMDTISALITGKRDETAIDQAIDEFDIVLKAIANQINVGDDLSAAIDAEADAFVEAIDALLNGTISEVYEAMIKEIFAYKKIFVILKEADGTVDVSEEVNVATDALCNTYIGLYKLWSDNYLSVQEATEQFTNGFVKICNDFKSANNIDDSSIDAAIAMAVAEFKEAIDAASNGQFDQESASASSTGWTEAALGLVNYTNCNVDEVSVHITNAANAFQEVTRASVHGSRSEVSVGVYKAMRGYVGVMTCLSENMGDSDLSEEINESWEAYPNIFNGLYENRINDASNQESE